MIRDVVPNSPADNAGLKAGDEIVKVDEISVVGVPHDKVLCVHYYAHMHICTGYTCIDTHTHMNMHTYCTHLYCTVYTYIHTYVQYNIMYVYVHCPHMDTCRYVCIVHTVHEDTVLVNCTIQNC